MLLLAFKKVAEELMNKKRKEMLNEAEARKGDVRFFFSPSSPLSPIILSSSCDVAETLSPQYYDGTFSSSGFSPAAFLGIGKDDPTGKDLTWIGDYADELAVNIATREFDEGVGLVEKGAWGFPSCSLLLSSR